jgi:hypothetical protein
MIALEDDECKIASAKLRLADGVFYAERGGKHLFLLPSRPDWLVVNQNGSILLSRCDGHTSLEEILAPTSAFGSLFHQAQALFSEALSRGILVDPASTPNGNPEIVLPVAPRCNKPVLVASCKIPEAGLNSVLRRGIRL